MKKKYTYKTKTVMLPNGKRKYLRAKTKAELDEKYAAAVRELSAGVDISNTSTVKEYTELWYSLTKSGSVSVTTEAADKRMLKKYIYPVIGNMKIREVRGTNIREVMRGAHNLCKGYQGRILSLLRNIFDAAVDDSIIIRSPVPLKMRAVGDPTGEAECLSPEEEKALLEAAKQTRLYPIVYTILNTGMRRGEVTALMWSDIDFCRREIRIRRHAIGDPNNSRVIIEEGAKTSAGERTIPMTDALTKFLQDLQKSAKSVYVFPNTKGTVYSPSLLTHHWERLNKIAGFHTHPHTLRHTYATKLFESNKLDIKQIQTVMGHADPSITLKVYTHYREGSRHNDTMEQIRAALA